MRPLKRLFEGFVQMFSEAVDSDKFVTVEGFLDSNDLLGL